MMQSNGNNQLNKERDNHNKKVEKLNGLGKTRRERWNAKRRNRTI